MPDLLGTLRLGVGEGTGKDYIEYWHVQLGSVARNLGLENDNNAFEQTVAGWGVSLSGALRFFLNNDLEVREGLFYSVTYGEGIVHYIVDVQSSSLKTFGNDAIVNSAGELVALPALAWYVSYQHNWTNDLRTSITYSHVVLDSSISPGQSVSPYRFGEYAGINLVYHRDFTIATDKPGTSHTFFTGLEFLYGQRQSLDGALGHDNRILLMLAFSK